MVKYVFNPFISNFDTVLDNDDLDGIYLKLDGSNANQTVDIGVNFFAGEGTMMYEYLDQSGANQLFGWNVTGLSRENKWSSPSPFKILNTVEIYDGSNNPVLTAASNVDVGLSSMTSTNPYLRISGYDDDAKVAKTGTLQVDVTGAFNIRSATGEILSLALDNQVVTMGAAGATDYYQMFDGTDTQFYTSGDFAFNGTNVTVNAVNSLNTLTLAGTSTALTNWQTLSLYSTTAQAADAGAGIMWGGTYKDASADIAGFASMAGRKENATSNNVAGYIQFGTRPNGGSVTERMRIDSAGNMIVGGTSANNIFEVSSATDATAQITRLSTTAGHYSQLVFCNSTDNTLIASAVRNTRLAGGEGRLGLFVSTDATEGNLTEYLSVFSDGNVSMPTDNAEFQMGAAGATDYYQTFDGTDAQFYTSGDFKFAGDVISTAEVESAKSKMTLIGGLAIKVTNKTGSVTIAGQLVKADTATDDAVILAGASDVECFGVFLDAGIADAAEAWVVVSGIADVAMKDNTAATRGNWVATSSEAGYADATSATPAAAPTHFNEIGHCIETVAAGGAGTHILARCVLHFN